MTLRPLPSWTSHAQPEPNWVLAASVNSSRKAWTDPKALLIASASSPDGSPPPVGLRQFQKKVWFHTWAALLNSGVWVSAP
jgi:hypothetical protein